MQPPRILVFVFSVLAILFLVSIFFPREGIRINDRITLQFITLEEILGSDSIQYADISAILSSSQAINDSTYLAMLEDPVDETLLQDTVRVNEDSLKVLVYPIEYPGGDSTLLYPFFRKLRWLKSSGDKLRIMHYGDSQIEGDRMTSFIRYKLQDQFGGSGIGMQPPVSLYGYQISLRHTASDNWRRYTAFGKVDSTLQHNVYGALGSFARFSDYPDSLETDTTVSEAWISLKQSKRSFYRSRIFKNCILYYGNASSPVFFEVYTDGQLFDADYLESSEGLQTKSWSFEESPEELTIKFKSVCSPDFYGIALDPESGLSVDNIPMRGSAGLLFSRIDPDMLRQMYDSLNVKLLLLQFGGNVVPYITDNYTYYERWFYRELVTLKSLVPDLSIIVIGVADMSMKEKDKFVSYPNLENVRDALRSASFRADCAFWDMYSAMGGYNSMPSWVFAQPPLATSDFVHFNEKGARVLAEMFYNALIHDYNAYVSSGQ
ncbi:MAG TPA: hypothetical protein ENI20_14450 [Bacteroides sp.]|nr:hypothetical protein [Bacteroides sp.]